MDWALPPLRLHQVKSYLYRAWAGESAVGDIELQHRAPNLHVLIGEYPGRNPVTAELKGHGPFVIENKFVSDAPGRLNVKVWWPDHEDHISPGYYREELVVHGVSAAEALQIFEHLQNANNLMADSACQTLGRDNNGKAATFVEGTQQKLEELWANDNLVRQLRNYVNQAVDDWLMNPNAHNALQCHLWRLNPLGVDLLDSTGEDYAWQVMAIAGPSAPILAEFDRLRSIIGKQYGLPEGAEQAYLLWLLLRRTAPAVAHDRVNATYRGPDIKTGKTPAKTGR